MSPRRFLTSGTVVADPKTSRIDNSRWIRSVFQICVQGAWMSLLLLTSTPNSAQVCLPEQTPDQAKYMEEQEPVRRALVIGNAAYESHAPLPSATADALEVFAKLKELKFQIFSPNELPLELKTRDEFSKALSDFSRTINEGDLVVFYFSGHGFSYGADGFLAPTQLPQCVRENKLPDVAFPVDSVKSLLESKNPGLLIMILDACRTIGSFVIRSADPSPCHENASSTEANFAVGGLPQPRGDNGAVNSIVAFATKPGKVAVGTSTQGQMSVYTRRLVPHITTEGKKVKEVLSTAATHVAFDTNRVQIPEAISSWITDPFLRPTTLNLTDEKEAWCVALDSREKESIQIYSYNYAVSRYAAISRKWLKDHAELAPAGFTRVSPIAVERAFRADNLRLAVRSLEETAFAFPRKMNVGLEKDLATAGDRELGIVPSGTTQRNLAIEKTGEKYLTDNWGIESNAKRTERLAFTIASIDVHENVVTTQDLVARAQPDEQAKVLDQISKGTSLRVTGLSQGPNDNVWLRVQTEQSSSSLFVKFPSFVKRRPLVELGNSLKEIVARAHPDHIPELIDPLPLQDAIRELRNEGWKITWVSLATGAINDKKQQETRNARLAHARYLLKLMDIPGIQITAVTGTNDFKDEGVRVRIFGVPQGAK